MTDKKDKIISSAIKRFNHYGISKTTMQEIANDAGLAVGTLYLYFKNKDEIVIACANEFAKEHLKLAEQILNSDEPASKKLKKYILLRYKASESTRTKSPHAVEITRAVIRAYPERIKDEANWLYQNILSILNYGNKTEEFKIKDTEEDAKVFLYSVAFFFPMATYEMPEFPNESDLITVIDWFINNWKNYKAKK